MRMAGGRCSLHITSLIRAVVCVMLVVIPGRAATRESSSVFNNPGDAAHIVCKISPAGGVRTPAVPQEVAGSDEGNDAVTHSESKKVAPARREIEPPRLPPAVRCALRCH